MAGKDKSYVELLKPRSLHKGMKLWGCVSEIARDTLIVSVPHGLR